ncbi:MAG TPA: hypothetical protein VFS07_08820 [Gemmatimonadales bacterium]|nr:hypothetical protein [Gemmatimonadales bacterium]
MELPTSHRVPLSWLLEHGGESIRYRLLAEIAPAHTLAPDALATERAHLPASKGVQAVVKRQKDTGIWGANLLATGPSAKDGIKEAGTVPQYRRLLQLGLPADHRPLRLAERTLFRLLSRDEDPALQFEYQKLCKAEPLAAEWVRGVEREAATAALAEAGHIEDPRIRGSAHKIASAVSTFLRSPLAEKPFQRSGSNTILNPEAHPPTWYSLAMLAAMPNLQRERAGFTERLGQYLAHPAPKKAFVVQLGKKNLKPTHLLLGDPIQADGKGLPKDVPLALHYIELLARIGALPHAPVATKVLGRLLKDCDDQGIWSPKNLRSAPKAVSSASFHTYPLVAETKSAESRQVDVTFRLALIAKVLGWSLEYE